ncbi:rho-related BTB domain-containing protein 3 isoform X3 [Neopelma chrysocephalum]|uniref:rho-related BTB domain-containing protein 3 isoform X3 n=1 Tax=Neopelma chrysocephalum TaxID=114329 RepID=UPI000FCD11B1|nr:rho-related BTB domain-containing protein 3 isoform X3 [Neopelma chrysocephalum]
MSVNIVAFGNERDVFSEDSQQPSLIWSYLGRSALISQVDSSLSASHVGNPVFAEYQACVFGNVRLVVHDCPVWDIFASDWYTSCRLIGGADIIVIKYSVNDKTSFQELKDSYVPMVKKALNHCSVPVIISAIGARKNGVPCTCPLCTSDRRSCVTTSEGVQLAKELGATYLELHTLNDFYIQKYFGGVLEYFMIQSLNQKSSEKMKKRKKIQKCHRVQPPQLEQPEKMPILKGEASHYNTDLHNLLCGCQCADVAFYPEDLSTVTEAHKVILCSVSPLFMLLFGVKSPADIPDTSVVQMARSLFAVEAGAASPLAPYGAPPCILPIRVVVKDSVFCSCLPDILLFIYSGAFQWERLEEDIKKKLKDPEKTDQVLEKVKCILKTPGKRNPVKDCRSHQIKQLCNTSLRLFFNTPVLADVIFKIQGCCWLGMCLSCPSRSRQGLASSGFTSMGNPAKHIYVLEFDDLQIWCHQYPPHFTAQHTAVSFLEI